MDYNACSLRELLDRGEASERLVSILQCQMIDEMRCAIPPVHLSPENVFVDIEHKIVLISADDSTPAVSEAEMVRDYGRIVLGVLEKYAGDKDKLRATANACAKGDITKLDDLYKLNHRRIKGNLYIPITVFIVVLIALLAFLDSYFK